MEKLQVYKCNVCGNIVELLHVGGGPLYCCGQPMELLQEQTADAAGEKHVPYIERVDGKYIVKVGQNQAHPMDEKHYIEWIELIVDGKVYRKFLNPGDKPEAEFEVPEGKDVYAREFCTLHGLWKGVL
jgi:superoxide reductase